jgi:hypothetical protein
MDRGTPQTANSPSGDLGAEPDAGAQPCPGTKEAPRPILNLGNAFVRTIRHFWPELNDWIDAIPDSRFQPYVTYDKRFLVWWGLSLYLFQLGARRQLDFELDCRDSDILANLNRLAQTEQDTRPVHKTLHHFLGHTGVAPYACLRRRMLMRLIRSKAIDAARLQGCLVVALDATGHLTFSQKHCEHCLVQRHATHTTYMHQLLEAKLLGPANMALSMATEFIENRDDNDSLGATLDNETRKQDCELKALSRLMPTLRADFPQLRVCLSGDSLYACGRTLKLAQDHDCRFVLVFKEGRMKSVWQEFQTLLTLCPQNRLEHRTADGVRQVYRWVHDLSYQDDEGRSWTFHAIVCEETVCEGTANEQTTTFAWITDLHVGKNTVVEVATKGGRHRWHVENQGFNRQKNSGLNLEHAYCTNADLIKAYYYLMQIAHMILQIFEAGSLLRRLAAECGQTPWQLFGGLANLARRLRESFRYRILSDDAFNPSPNERIRYSFDSS